MGEININFINSIADLIVLLDKKYPKKASLELVGNRYNLNRDERLILYRGVFDTAGSNRRKKKRLDLLHAGDTADLNIKCLILDGYNILISLESYLKGMIIFRALDGYVRDVSGVYGSHSFSGYTERSAGLLADFIKDLTEKFDSRPDVSVYLDSQVSKSGELSMYMRDLFKREHISAEVAAIKNPDAVIVELSRRCANSLTATSDTVLIDEVGRVIDIPDCIIRQVFGTAPLDLNTLLLSKKVKKSG
ncbi:MAG TPA: DUF434 domain-containing protein [Spirochaetes bacterium]|nr:DUF434 domain-containing protein [Spirochaetota bacterium]